MNRNFPTALKIIGALFFLAFAFAMMAANQFPIYNGILQSPLNGAGQPITNLGSLNTTGLVSSAAAASASSNLTRKDYVDAVTNGLASTNYANGLTNGLANSSITNNLSANLTTLSNAFVITSNGVTSISNSMNLKQIGSANLTNFSQIGTNNLLNNNGGQWTNGNAYGNGTQAIRLTGDSGANGADRGLYFVNDGLSDAQIYQKTDTHHLLITAPLGVDFSGQVALTNGMVTTETNRFALATNSVIAGANNSTALTVSGTGSNNILSVGNSAFTVGSAGASWFTNAVSGSLAPTVSSNLVRLTDLNGATNPIASTRVNGLSNSVVLAVAGNLALLTNGQTLTVSNTASGGGSGILTSNGFGTNATLVGIGTNALLIKPGPTNYAIIVTNGLMGVTVESNKFLMTTNGSESVHIESGGLGYAKMVLGTESDGARFRVIANSQGDTCEVEATRLQLVDGTSSAGAYLDLNPLANQCIFGFNSSPLITMHLDSGDFETVNLFADQNLGLQNGMFSVNSAGSIYADNGAFQTDGSGNVQVNGVLSVVLSAGTAPALTLDNNLFGSINIQRWNNGGANLANMTTNGLLQLTSIYVTNGLHFDNNTVFSDGSGNVSAVSYSATKTSSFPTNNAPYGVNRTYAGDNVWKTNYNGRSSLFTMLNMNSSVAGAAGIIFTIESVANSFTNTVTNSIPANVTGQHQIPFSFPEIPANARFRFATNNTSTASSSVDTNSYILFTK